MRRKVPRERQPEWLVDWLKHIKKVRVLRLNMIYPVYEARGGADAQKNPNTTRATQ